MYVPDGSARFFWVGFVILIFSHLETALSTLIFLIFIPLILCRISQDLFRLLELVSNCELLERRRAVFRESHFKFPRGSNQYRVYQYHFNDLAYAREKSTVKCGLVESRKYSVTGTHACNRLLSLRHYSKCDCRSDTPFRCISLSVIIENQLTTSEGLFLSPALFVSFSITSFHFAKSLSSR